MEQRFGALVYAERIRQQQTLEQVARAAALDVSTISRIEHAKTEATLLTAIRLCETLHIPPRHVVHTLGGTIQDERGWTALAHHAGNEVLTLHDLQLFLQGFSADPDQGRQLVMDLLNTVATALEHCAGMPEGRLLQFCREDIDKLLAETELYHFQLRYPLHMAADLILTLWRTGGGW